MGGVGNPGEAGLILPLVFQAKRGSSSLSIADIDGSIELIDGL